MTNMETILVVNAGSSSLGAALDPGANAVPQLLISRPNSRVALYAIPTDEELMIARHTLSVLSRDAAVARRRFAS